MSEPTWKDDPVTLTAGDIEQHLIEIEKMFQPEVRLTFLARTPNEPERDLLLTRDDPSEVIKAIQRRTGSSV